MIHQSQVFVCPGQTHGISWNICLGRQAKDWEICQKCSYQGWHEQGLPGFNPYVGAFTPSEDQRSRLKEAPTKPSFSRRVFDESVKSFVPEDIGLESKVSRKKTFFDLFSKIYTFF